MANLCIKTPSFAILVLIFQLLVLRPRPSDHVDHVAIDEGDRVDHVAVDHCGNVDNVVVDHGGHGDQVDCCDRADRGDANNDEDVTLFM